MITRITYQCDWPGCEEKLIIMELEPLTDYYWELDDAVEFLQQTNSIGQL